ncbi:MAG: hypothetical protein GQ574_25090 [Crocinitomix sp.]|nr:hypothetical protein [Crocinitomix sp.]
MKALILIALFVSSFAYGQSVNYNDSLITLKGTVIDTNYSVGFYNVVVLNKTVGKGIFGDYTGKFNITFKKTDTIGVSVHGYQTMYISFADSAYKKVYNTKFYIKELSIVAEEVIVRPLKTLEELKEERASIAKREVATVTVVNAIESPITALYMAFSKREKTKRFVAEMEYKDQQYDVVKEILRVYVHNDIFDLTEDDFDEFIRFINLNVEFLKSASDYDLVTYIKAKFEHFQKIKEGF